MRAFQERIREKKLSGRFAFPNGSIEFYQNGKRHREDGPAILATEGGELWYWEDKLHRTDGPAVKDADGDLAWYKHGKLHREDGPALISGDGNRKAWFVDGVEVLPS